MVKITIITIYYLNIFIFFLLQNISNLLQRHHKICRSSTSVVSNIRVVKIMFNRHFKEKFMRTLALASMMLGAALSSSLFAHETPKLEL
jgi:hypothetical protein